MLTTDCNWDTQCHFNNQAHNNFRTNESRQKQSFIMNNYKRIAALFLLCILFSCDKYNLDRTNPHDPKNKNYTPSVPELTTTAATVISGNSAAVTGYVTSDGGASVTARGVCWSTSSNSTIANSKTTDGGGTGTFTSSITGLSPNTTYYVRAYATNIVGTAYANELSFTTDPSVVSDIEGNIYNLIRIGKQLWMKENLKVIHYRNGDTIPNVTDGTAWMNLTTGAYCDYDNTPDNSTTYGKLYNWYAVADSRNVCPTGWHVPTNVEWNILSDYLGGRIVAGDKLKETGTAHWVSPNTGATNSGGFTALPGGGRYDPGNFWNIGYHANWWSSTEYDFDTNKARHQNVRYDNSYLGESPYVKQAGFSVRCVRD